MHPLCLTRNPQGIFHMRKIIYSFCALFACCLTVITNINNTKKKPRWWSWSLKEQRSSGITFKRFTRRKVCEGRQTRGKLDRWKYIMQAWPFWRREGRMGKWKDPRLPHNSKRNLAKLMKISWSTVALLRDYSSPRNQHD